MSYEKRRGERRKPEQRKRERRSIKIDADYYADHKEEFTTIQETAERYRLSVGTIWNYIQSKKIKAVRIGGWRLYIHKPSLKGLVKLEKI